MHLKGFKAIVCTYLIYICVWLKPLQAIIHANYITIVKTRKMICKSRENGYILIMVLYIFWCVCVQGVVVIYAFLNIIMFAWVAFKSGSSSIIDFFPSHFFLYSHSLVSAGNTSSMKDEEWGVEHNTYKLFDNTVNLMAYDWNSLYHWKKIRYNPETTETTGTYISRSGLSKKSL